MFNILETTSGFFANVNAREGVRLREGPGTEFNVKSLVPFGTSVQVLRVDSDWALVDLQHDGAADGYCHKGFLSPAPALADILQGIVPVLAATTPVVDALIEQIRLGKIIFDADKMKLDLLGQSPGLKVTTSLQSLVLEVSKISAQPIRISSVIRQDNGHHGLGRAFDIGNEEIASALLPKVVQRIAELNIDELIFDAAKAGQANRNKWNHDEGLPHEFEDAALDEHGNHIHLSVRPS